MFDSKQKINQSLPIATDDDYSENLPEKTRKKQINIFIIDIIS
jgi:hypothetical protein